MASRKPTLLDVADAAGVDPSTVSRALSPVPGRSVKQETAQRILAEAERLGFRPNRLARGLRTQRSNSIGLLVPDIANPLMPQLVHGIEETLSQGGYTLLLTASQNDPDLERRGIEVLAAHQIDGLIAASASQSESTFGAQIANLGVPTILALRRDEKNNFPHVVTNEIRGMLIAVEHLVGLGHTRLAYLSGPLNGSHMVDRLEGLGHALAHYGIDPEECLVLVREEYGLEEGKLAMLEALGRQPVTAVIAGNVMMGLGCYNAFEDRGLSCPEDISLVAFNDTDMAAFLTPAMTAIRNPFYQMGVSAAENLLALVNDGSVQQSLLLDPELIVRKSTSACQGNTKADATSAGRDMP